MLVASCCFRFVCKTWESLHWCLSCEHIIYVSLCRSLHSSGSFTAFTTSARVIAPSTPRLANCETSCAFKTGTQNRSKSKTLWEAVWYLEISSYTWDTMKKYQNIFLYFSLQGSYDENGDGELSMDEFRALPLPQQVTKWRLYSVSLSFFIEFLHPHKSLDATM